MWEFPFSNTKSTKNVYSINHNEAHVIAAAQAADIVILMGT